MPSELEGDGGGGGARTGGAQVAGGMRLATRRVYRNPLCCLNVAWPASTSIVSHTHTRQPMAAAFSACSRPRRCPAVPPHPTPPHPTPPPHRHDPPPPPHPPCAAGLVGLQQVVQAVVVDLHVAHNDLAGRRAGRGQGGRTREAQGKVCFIAAS